MLCRYDVVVPAELEGGAPKCACVAGRRPAGRVQPRTHAGRETPGPDAGCLYAVKTISKQVTGASLARRERDMLCHLRSPFLVELIYASSAGSRGEPGVSHPTPGILPQVSERCEGVPLLLSGVASS